MTQMFKSGYLTFPWSNSLRLGKDSFFSTIMQIRHYCNFHASSGSGALRSQSSVHCCVRGGGEPYPGKWGQRFPGATLEVGFLCITVDLQTFTCTHGGGKEESFACVLRPMGGWHWPGSPPLSDYISKSASRTGMTTPGTCPFRQKAKQVATCLTLHLGKGL